MRGRATSGSHPRDWRKACKIEGGWLQMTTGLHMPRRFKDQWSRSLRGCRMNWSWCWMKQGKSNIRSRLTPPSWIWRCRSRTGLRGWNMLWRNLQHLMASKRTTTVLREIKQHDVAERPCEIGLSSPRWWQELEHSPRPQKYEHDREDVQVAGPKD